MVCGLFQEDLLDSLFKGVTAEGRKYQEVHIFMYFLREVCRCVLESLLSFST